MPRRRSAFALALTAWVLGLAAPLSLAQGAPNQPVPTDLSVRYFPNPNYTLSKVWPDLLWDAARQGPLIAVEPPDALSRMFVWPGVRLMPMPPPERGPNGYSAQTVRDYYGLKPLTLATLTALAPTEMVVLNTKLGEPDLLRGMLPRERERLLLASLTPAQWKALGSPQGIGPNNLDRDQQAIFESLMSEPFRITRSQVDPTSGARRDLGTAATLTPQARAGVRLRMTREVSVSFPAANKANGWVTQNGGRQLPEGDVLRVDRDDFGPRSFGATIAESIPNRQKPGNLAFDSPALDARISLAPPEGRQAGAVAPLTVGELVRRAAAATHVELYCDPRAAGHIVLTRGASARAGDVLRALCLCVTGTFRKVGPAFVLTDDLLGIGARRMLISEWSQDAQRRVIELTMPTLQKLRDATQPDALGVSFAEGADLPLSPDKMTGISPGWSWTSARGSVVAMSDLPVAWQDRLRAQALQINAQQQRRAALAQAHPNAQLSDYSVRDDHVRVGVQLTLTYLVPGGGAVSEYNQLGGWGMTTEPPAATSVTSAGGAATRAEPAGAPARPAAPPLGPALERFPVRALCVAAASAEEAARAVREAKRYGFTQAWITVPPDGDAVLAAAVAAGKEQNLLVVAVVPALLRDAKAVPPGLADLDVLGETTSAHAARRARSAQARRDALSQPARRPAVDWLRFDRPNDADAVEQPILAAARVRGLAGLAVRCSAPPGYRDSGRQAGFVSSDGSSPELGYTAEMRLAFLRKESADPIDLPPADTFSALSDLPYFSDRAFQRRVTQGGGEIAREGPEPAPVRWRRFRYERGAALLRDLFGKLHAARPELPLLLDDRAEQARYEGFFVPWDRPDAIPDVYAHRVLSPYGPPRERDAAGAWALLRVRPFTRGYYGVQPPPGAPPEKPDAFASSLAFQLDREAGERPPWQGLVVDLSDAPLDRALAQLAGFPEGK